MTASSRLLPSVLPEAWKVENTPHTHTFYGSTRLPGAKRVPREEGGLGFLHSRGLSSLLQASSCRRLLLLPLLLFASSDCSPHLPRAETAAAEAAGSM